MLNSVLDLGCVSLSFEDQTEYCFANNDGDDEFRNVQLLLNHDEITVGLLLPSADDFNDGISVNIDELVINGLALGSNGNLSV